MKRGVILLAMGMAFFIGVGMQSVFAQFISSGRNSGAIQVIQVPPPPGFSKPHKHPGFQGVLPQIVRLKKPWELINPCAPPEYGNGSANAMYWDWSTRSFVTKDPNDDSVYKGITIFGISW